MYSLISRSVSMNTWPFVKVRQTSQPSQPLKPHILDSRLACSFNMVCIKSIFWHTNAWECLQGIGDFSNQSVGMRLVLWIYERTDGTGWHWARQSSARWCTGLHSRIGSVCDRKSRTFAVPSRIAESFACSTSLGLSDRLSPCFWLTT